VAGKKLLQCAGDLLRVALKNSVTVVEKYVLRGQKFASLCRRNVEGCTQKEASVCSNSIQGGGQKCHQCAGELSKVAAKKLH
jgi:hypothetical protein